MRCFLVIQCALVLVSGTAYSQTAAVPDSTIATLRTAESRNQLVRLYTGQRVVTGRLQDVRSDNIRIQRAAFPWHQVDSVQIRFVHNDPLWNGALIGAGVTALLTRVLVQMASGLGESPLTTREKRAAWFGGALTGAVIGICIDGALVGDPSWQTVWNR